MTFDEMVADIVGWTKRPDMDARIRAAIRSVTLKYHRRHKFFKDLSTVVLTPVDMNTGVGTYDIPTFLPQWRQFCAITPDTSLTPLVAVTPDTLLDLDGYALTNIYLVAGTSLQIKMRSGGSIPTVTYWKDPIVWPQNLFNSWIASEQPDLIIAGAAKKVFAFDNESEIFKAAAIEETEQLATLVESNLEIVGR